MEVFLESLEHYLASDYLAEKQEIKVIDQTLAQVEGTFSYLYDPEAKGWPYEFRASAQTLSAATESQGTLAMALLASGRILGYCQLPAGNFREKTKASDLFVDSWRNSLKNLLSSSKTALHLAHLEIATLLLLVTLQSLLDLSTLRILRTKKSS